MQSRNFASERLGAFGHPPAGDCCELPRLKTLRWGK